MASAKRCCSARLAVEAEQRLIGDMDARSPSRALPSGVFEIGIELYDPTHRGRGYGTEAVRLLTGWLFEHAGAARVQASTAVDNVSMQKVLEKAGFASEGVMRKFMPSTRGRVDYILYAITSEAGR